jgi:hypothetical protein
MPKDKAGVQLPADLASLSDDQLAQLLSDIDAEFDTQIDLGEGDPDQRLARATELADMHDTVIEQQSHRAEVALEREQTAQALRDRVRPQVAEPVVEEPVAEPAPVLASASVGARPGELADRLMSGQPLPTPTRKLNPTLADIQRNAPSVNNPPRRRESVLIASSDIPGFGMGTQLSDMDALVAAMTARARGMATTNLGKNAPWIPVASLRQEHKYTLDMNATPAQIDEVLQAAANPEALVAAGGWCSPSQISYDFFNIVCEDGILDLPSVGINRGGLRWPTSASYADITGNFWSWNETQDIAAVTGTGQSGTKTCIRVPCPAYNEQRLHCDGFCMTVGNLMEDAFPELIANHTRLMMAGQAHRLNQLRITELLNNSTAITGYSVAGSGLVAPVLGNIEMCAIDYREKFAMCVDAVLEVVLPRWLRGAMRSDLRKRTNGELDFMQVTDAQLMSWFDLINVRVQWVGDWQVRGAGQPGNATPITAWPTTVQFLMFAAGTFVLGRGLQLNLGIIRDSVLNATNDHTAEWMEECWLVAKIGHESRLGTIAICPDGTTGAADLTACAP